MPLIVLSKELIIHALSRVSVAFNRNRRLASLTDSQQNGIIISIGYPELYHNRSTHLQTYVHISSRIKICSLHIMAPAFFFSPITLLVLYMHALSVCGDTRKNRGINAVWREFADKKTLLRFFNLTHVLYVIIISKL